MAYIATAVARGKDGWSAAEVDLSNAADFDEVADQLREVDPQADVSLLFVEADDAYLAVARLDATEDLRVFGTDVAFRQESRLGAILLGDLAEPALPVDDALGADADTDSAPAAAAEPEPVGDADLLADLGLPGDVLMEICGREGMLPADMTAELTQVIGCGDEVEELREA